MPNEIYSNTSCFFDYSPDIEGLRCDMGTTKEDIKEWIKRGKDDGATHMIVVVDTFDWEDYPVYVKADEDCRKKYDSYNGKEMQRVMEVYDLRIDIPTQLNTHRNFKF